MVLDIESQDGYWVFYDKNARIPTPITEPMSTEQAIAAIRNNSIVIARR